MQPTVWPSCSPHLTTADFFLWHHIKEQVQKMAFCMNIMCIILNVNSLMCTQLDILHKLYVQMQISVHFFKKGKQDFRNTNIMCKLEYLIHIHFYNFWQKHLLVLQLFEKSHLSETKKYCFCDSCSGVYLGLIFWEVMLCILALGNPM